MPCKLNFKLSQATSYQSWRLSGLLPVSFLAVLFVSFKALVSLKRQLLEVEGSRDIENAIHYNLCFCFVLCHREGMMMRFVALGVPHACVSQLPCSQFLCRNMQEF